MALAIDLDGELIIAGATSHGAGSVAGVLRSNGTQAPYPAILFR